MYPYIIPIETMDICIPIETMFRHSMVRWLSKLVLGLFQVFVIMALLLSCVLSYYSARLLRHFYH